MLLALSTSCVIPSKQQQLTEITPTSRIAPPHEVPEQSTEGRVGGLQLVEGGQTETDGFLWGPPLHVVETADGGRVPAGGSQGVDRVRGNSDHLGGTVGRG